MQNYALFSGNNLISEWFPQTSQRLSLYFIDNIIYWSNAADNKKNEQRINGRCF